MKCITCGILVEDGYKFCPQCGTSVEANSASVVASNSIDDVLSVDTSFLDSKDSFLSDNLGTDKALSDNTLNINESSPTLESADKESLSEDEPVEATEYAKDGTVEVAENANDETVEVAEDTKDEDAERIAKINEERAERLKRAALTKIEERAKRINKTTLDRSESTNIERAKRSEKANIRGAKRAEEEKRKQLEFEKSVDQRVQQNKRFSIFPKFVISYYIKQAVLFAILIAVSILVVVLCAAYASGLNNPATFNTYQDLQRLNSQSFSHVTLNVGDVRTFSVNPRVQAPGIGGFRITSPATDPNIRRYVYVEGTYILIQGTRLLPRQGIITLSVSTAYTPSTIYQIERRIDALRDAQNRARPTFGADTVQDFTSAEIANLRSISNNMGTVRLSTVDSESRSSLSYFVIFVFAVLALVFICMGADSFLFLIAPKASGVYRNLKTFGDAEKLFAECEKSFGLNGLKHPGRIETNRKFIIIFYFTRIFIAPIEEARRGNVQEYVSLWSGRRSIFFDSTRYSYRLHLSFSNGMSLSVKLSDHSGGESVLSYIKNVNKNFNAGNFITASGISR